MRALMLMAILLLPMAANAQLVIENGKNVSDKTEAAGPADTKPGPAEAVIQGTDFPASAITSVDKNGKVGGTLTSTPAPATNASGKIAADDDKLWPKDTVAIFVTSCANMHKELVAPCRCTIQQLMANMDHAEFMKLSKDESIQGDARYQQARSNCMAAPAQRQE